MKNSLLIQNVENVEPIVYWCIVMSVYRHYQRPNTRRFTRLMMTAPLAILILWGLNTHFICHSKTEIIQKIRYKSNTWKILPSQGVLSARELLIEWGGQKWSVSWMGSVTTGSEHSNRFSNSEDKVIIMKVIVYKIL